MERKSETQKHQGQEDTLKGWLPFLFPVCRLPLPVSLRLVKVIPLYFLQRDQLVSARFHAQRAGTELILYKVCLLYISMEFILWALHSIITLHYKIYNNNMYL